MLSINNPPNGEGGATQNRTKTNVEIGDYLNHD